MPEISFGDIADQAIKNFIKSVVLIDDHWSEAQSAPDLESLDLSQLNLEPQSFPPQGGAILTSTTQEEENPTVSAEPANQAYLREISKEIISQGVTVQRNKA